MKMRYPVVEVMRVVDADTFDLHLDLGLRQYGHYRIRLAYVDAPEVYGRYASEAGREATVWTQGWFDQAGELWCEVIEEGSFSRWIADLHDVTADVWLSEAMMEAGHAEEYR